MGAPALPGAAPSLPALARAFEIAGWDLRVVDVDLVAGRLVVEIHRFDGRWLYLAARADGGATLERWHRTATVKRAFGAPNGAQFDTFDDQFLGRSRAEGIRSGLRSLSTYIAENPCPGRTALPVSTVRALLAPLLV
jgi:hypothetical protein